MIEKFTKILLLTGGLISLYFFGASMAFAASSVEVVSPRGEDAYTLGEYVNISWKSTEVDSVSLFLISNSGTIRPIISNTPNIGTYLWKIDVEGMFPDQTKHYYIKIISYHNDGTSTFTRSDGYFSVTNDTTTGSSGRVVTPQLEVLQPKAGDVLSIGNIYTTVWSGTVERVDIDLMESEGVRAAVLASNLPVVGLSDEYQYSFVIPQTVKEGRTYRIKISGKDSQGTSIIKWSDTFSVAWEGELDTTNTYSDIPSNAVPVTLPATDITPSSAVLVGAINPNDNLGVYVWFEVVPTLPEKTYVTPKIFIPAESRVYEKKSLITGLTPETTYTYRMEGDVRGAKTRGEFISFTTKPLQYSIEINETLPTEQSPFADREQITLDSRKIGSSDDNVRTNYEALSGKFALGMENDRVINLQKMLAQDKNVYPEGITSGYYGTLTQRAVERFQIKYDIVKSGTPLTTGFGMVGPTTLKKLNSVYVRAATLDPIKVSPVTEEQTRESQTQEEVQSVITSLLGKVRMLEQQLRDLIGS